MKNNCQYGHLLQFYLFFQDLKYEMSIPEDKSDKNEIESADKGDEEINKIVAFTYETLNIGELEIYFELKCDN